MDSMYSFNFIIFKMKLPNYKIFLTYSVGHRISQIYSFEESNMPNRFIFLKYNSRYLFGSKILLSFYFGYTIIQIIWSPFHSNFLLHVVHSGSEMFQNLLPCYQLHSLNLHISVLHLHVVGLSIIHF